MTRWRSMSSRSPLRLRSTEPGSLPVITGSLWMVMSTGAVAVGSFVFWLAATRLGDADLVGRASGLFSLVFFLSFVTSLGVPVAVGRFGATSDPLDTRRFRMAIVTVIGSATVGAAVVVAIDPSDLLDPVNRWGRFVGWLLLASLAAGVAVSIVGDLRLMGHRRWRDVFVRSTAIGIVRLPFVGVAIGDDSGLALAVLAVSGYIVTALPYLPGLLRGAETGRIRWQDEREAISFARLNYASQLAIQAPFFVSPVVVALAVDDDANATFYLSWGVMSIVYLAIHVLGHTLLVEGGRDNADPRDQARTTLAIAVGLAVVASAVAIPGARIVERIYGAEHEAMSTLLPLLMIGTIAWAVTRTTLALARVTGQKGVNLMVSIWSATCVIAAVAVGASVSTTAAAIGWVIGNGAALVVSAPAMAHLLLSDRRSAPSQPEHAIPGQHLARARDSHDQA